MHGCKKADFYFQINLFVDSDGNESFQHLSHRIELFDKGWTRNILLHRFSMEVFSGECIIDPNLTNAGLLHIQKCIRESLIYTNVRIH